jgi:hypothetical protein
MSNRDSKIENFIDPYEDKDELESATGKTTPFNRGSVIF